MTAVWPRPDEGQPVADGPPWLAPRWLLPERPHLVAYRQGRIEAVPLVAGAEFEVSTWKASYLKDGADVLVGYMRVL